MRDISIFGATGSIGQNTLDLIRRNRDEFRVVALTGQNNISQLAADAVEFGAEFAVTANESGIDDLKHALAGTSVTALAGADAVAHIAEKPVDWAMNAIVGAAGLAPSLNILKNSKTLALANKESLVAAGALVLSTARDNGSQIIPVDSEHSAVFQALIGEDIASVDRIIITASGGPFRDWPVSRMARATLQEALKHPNWAMGQRITIDSASMFNKALELIETKEFFGVSPEQIEVIVHPESIVHALVGFNDGAIMAHMGSPDMRHAIGFSLNWPERKKLPVKPLDLAQLGSLNFEKPDEKRFPALRLAREVMQAEGHSGAIFNAAKEVALDGFIDGSLTFVQMAEVVEATLNTMDAKSGHEGDQMTLDSVLQADRQARETTKTKIAKLA